MEKKEEWVSISTMAKLIGKSEQTVRNNVKKGLYETKTFERKSMKGILIRVPE